MFAFLKKLFKKAVPCGHEFDLADIAATGIPEIPMPTDRHDLKAWEHYYKNIYTCPGVTQRIKWPCWKCHKVFTGPYGLRIAENGKIVHRRQNG